MAHYHYNINSQIVIRSKIKKICTKNLLQHSVKKNQSISTNYEKALENLFSK